MKLFPLNIKKISYRLTMVYALVFFVALVLVNAGTLKCTDFYLKLTSQQQLDLIDTAVKSEVKTLDDIGQTDFKETARMADNVDVYLYSDGKLIYKTGENYEIPVLPVLKDVPRFNEVEDKELLYLSDQLVLSDGSHLEMQVIKDMDSENVYLYVLFGIFLVMDVFVLIISIVVGFLISKKALNPIDKITSQAKQISVSDLTKRIEIDGPDDELKRLADTFNDLIDRIQLAYEKQNQFTLDASHELATPLAVIKGYIDLIDRWGKDDREILNEGIASIKNELANMTRLLDTLLFVSKSDNEMLKLEMTSFSLSALIEEVVKESNLVTVHHSIDCTANETIWLQADRKLIKQMLRALIDNSIKYTPENGKIEISSCLKNSQAVVMVSDNGVGIPEEDLKNIFDRFYRVDKARSREFGGTGLGLSIVKWIIDLHGGSVTAESQVGKGTQMIVKLPIGN